MEINRLDLSVITKIRSSSSLNSVAQCVHELVCNSLDAKSSSIAVRINLLTFKIQVADNGDGITRENFDLVGQRYCTSKSKVLRDLERYRKTYGYKGETLSNILEISHSICISSRFNDSSETFTKTLTKHTKMNQEIRKAQFRPSIGTTITVNGFLSSIPVRQKRIIPEIEFEEIKLILKKLALINPTTSFTFRNDLTGALIFDTPKSANILEAFCKLHNEIDRNMFTLLKVKKSHVLMEILLNKLAVSMKNQYYIFVNKIPVNSQRISKEMLKNFDKNLTNKRKYPMYIMNIKCPQIYVDYYFLENNGKNNEIEFTCWNIIINCINKAMKSFKQETLIINKKIQNNNKEINCSISQIRGIVQGAAYKRKIEVDENKENYFLDEITDRRIIPSKKFKSSSSLVDFDENNGKNLIMEMFLKSTDAFKDEDSAEEENYPLINEEEIKIIQPINKTTTRKYRQTLIEPNYFKAQKNLLPPRIIQRKISSSESDGNKLAENFNSHVNVEDDFTLIVDNQNNNHNEREKFKLIRKNAYNNNNEEIHQNLELRNNNNKEQELLNNTTSKKIQDMFEEDLNKELIEQEEENFNNKIILDSQNEWLQKNNAQGERFFLNTRTGMVSKKTPFSNLNHQFNFENRLKNFIPKGMSPILKTHKDVETFLSQNGQFQLQNLILASFNDELTFAKWQNFNSKDPKKLFEKIYQSKSRNFENSIPIIQCKSTAKHPLNFNAKIFENIEIIGQLDKKFIVALEVNKNLIILFDQHAVHERIRVENLYEEYKAEKTSCKENFTIFMQKNDLEILQLNLNYIESIGIKLQFFTHGITVREIPNIFSKEKNTNNSNETLLKNLLKEILEILKINTTTKNSSILPDLIKNAINSNACRGAIKFGDKLTIAEMENLLLSLSKCKLPFQCAHGRPTLIPITNLTKLQSNAKLEKPNLKKLLFSGK